MFSLETWDEFNRVLEGFRATRRIPNKAAEDARSAILDASHHVRVGARFTGCTDPNDNKLFDVLEQSDAMWLCSDDRSVHAVGRLDIVGLGELVSMIEEVR